MTMSKRDRMVLMVLAALLAVGGTYWFLIKPARSEAATQRDQLTAIQGEIDLLTDQVSRLQAAAEKSTERVVEQFQLAKAVPDQDSLPGSILQLRRFSQQSDVQLRVIRTSTVSTLGSLRVTEVELEVLGKFWDVDDFMFRVHRTVSVNANDIPRVKGRLFAIKSAEVSLADETEATVATDGVTGLLRVLVFSAPPAGAGAASAAVTATSGGIQ